MSKKLSLTLIFLFYLMSAWSQTATSNIRSEIEIKFNPDIEYGEIRDSRDHRLYKTVKIGEQTWMAENMAYLPSVNAIKLKSIANPYYYVYGYEGSSTDEALSTYNYKLYGALYNYSAALRICPDGWHLPSHDDWDNLIKALNWHASAGNKMKESGSGHWIGNAKETTNESGLTILPGGTVEHNGNWDDLGKKANFWIAKSRDAENAHAISLANYSSWAAGSFFPKNSGLSVRCIKN